MSSSLSKNDGFKSLFQFDGQNGADPNAAMVEVNDTFYGTTTKGGSGNCPGGCGTVFKFLPSGAEHVIYSFKGVPDGEAPSAPLVNVGGVLYGTTTEGGTGYCQYSGPGCGTVFKITPSGSESVLYSFTSSGSNPEAGLTNVNGTLYGTTTLGGDGACAAGCGTIFKIATSGSESILFTFQGYPFEGFPKAGLLDVAGTLYGTTLKSVFKITTEGVETTLHTFGGPPDGASVVAGLTAIDGTLYGTTSQGGTGTCKNMTGCGTIFSITKQGAERVLYSFKGKPDGDNPVAELTDANGALYGTTSAGGVGCETDVYPGCGTVFRVSLSGSESTIYKFNGKSKGATPTANLTDVNGTLYSTTSEGGTNDSGTIFRISP